MRYFPQRARNKSDIGRKLKICTYCLGDMFADGRCVQCQARINVAQPPDVPTLLRRPPAWSNRA